MPYLCFVLLGALLYRLLPRRLCNVWLLLCCVAFYCAWTPQALPVLMGVSLLSYLGGLLLSRLRARERRTGPALALLLPLTLLPLLFIKYGNFFAGAAAPDLLVPLGISFFTLQALSYQVDVAKGKQALERNPLRYFLFMSFFPSISSGPICRAGQLLPQFSKKQVARYAQVKRACLRMLWGYFQKLVLAQRIGPWVDFVYSDPAANAGLPMWSAVLLYGVQIYCDFAGYTDIAIGTAGLFGFTLPENFDAPYMARSIRDFWRRWHISLSSWLRDYLYIPLGGSRCGKARKYGNVLLTFLASGLWHGAGWNFVLWGGLHGLYQVLGDVLRPLRERLCRALHLRESGFVRKLLATIWTLLLVEAAWVLFRTGTLEQAGQVFAALFAPGTQDTILLVRREMPNGEQGLYVLLVSMAILLLVQLCKRVKGALYPRFLRCPALLQWAAVAVLLLATLVFGVYGAAQGQVSFIYQGF